ncbi:helix-turn-helix domain-containing protein [Plantactinospora sp. CA-290183]|uniref:helix-turn-helix domain-containing protein n=1 Tax=Plantactinospora sp. CA-290183 TaxID=3240006 RepID=UPI003D93A357
MEDHDEQPGQQPGRWVVDAPLIEFIRAHLRRMRVAAGLSQEQFGKRINFSGSQVSAVETGTRPLDARYLALADRELETGGLFVELLRVATDGGRQTWFRSWRETERNAKSLRWFEPNLVPGLLQTEAYARAVITAGSRLSSAEIDRRVTSRLERQKLLTRELPVQLFAVLDATILDRLIGTCAIMREQLDHLVTMAELPNVDLLVVPTGIGMYVGLAGPLALAGLEGNSWIGYLDNLLRGQIITHADEIDSLQEAWECIRSEALPRQQSLNLIKEAAQKWI